MKHFLAIAALALFTNQSFSQDNWKNIKLQYPILNSDSVIKKGTELHDNEKYAEAIAEFEKINENDSNYVVAQYELINSLISFKKDSAAIIICDKIMNMDYTYTSKIIIHKANAYDNLKQYKTSEEIYMAGAKQFPNNPRFYHEYAVSLFRQKKYKEAHANFINALKVNPYYAPSHFQLGLFAVKEKKIIPAMLSFQYYLLLDNSSKRAQTIVSLLEQIGDDNINYADFETFDPIDENDDFSDVEAIVKSKAAYSDKFKSKVNLNFRVLKQIQVVLDKLEYNAGDKGFYNQFYAKFFKEMVSKGYTETYMYYILSEMKIEDATKWIEKNKSKVEQFGIWMRDYMANNYGEAQYTVNGSNVKGFKTYSYNELSGMGNYDSKKNRIGSWKFFFSNSGNVKSEGSYNDKSEREGPWRYYYTNGQVKEACTFKNDKLEGEYKKYYENGRLMQHLFYKEGKYNGKQTLYYANGSIKNTYDYKDGIFEGEEVGYYETGKLKYKASITAGNYNGEYMSYFENGSLKKTMTFVKGVRVGKYKDYYNYPKETLYSEGNYENDMPTGEWKFYYNNGKLNMTGLYNKKGLKDGIWKTYDRKGIQTQEDTYGDGKSEGVSKNYYGNGKVYEEYYYRKSKINQYKYYSESGALVKEIAKQKNEFDFELYNKNGTRRKSGKIVGEQFDGNLISYNYVGLKSELTEYKNEQVVNKEYTYYTNGNVLSETPYNNGVKNGQYNKYFIDGKPLTQGYYVNDNAEGYWFYYDRSGPLSEIRYYDNGEQYGWQRSFACDGKVYRADFMADGRVVERCYYDTLGTMIKRINFDSASTLAYTIPNFDGGVWLKRSVKNNLIDGLTINYHPNGTISSERPNDMEKENGIVKSYNIFGKLQREETYDMGQRNGKYTLFDNGKVEYTANYEADELMGEAIDYYENGKPSVKSNYVDGNLDGDQTYYDENGNLAIVLKYENDNLVGYTYENESGQLVPVIPVNKTDMEVKAFYKNKKPSVNFTIKNSEKDGTYTMYSSTGIKLSEINYTQGYLNGVRNLYFPSGKLQSKSNFFYSNYVGMFTEYYENGMKRSEFSYMNGSRHGLSTYYDTTGKVTLKCYYYDDSSMKIIK